MENKKYVLTDETMEFEGHTLHRIECVTPFRVGSVGIWINKGNLGGWIEKEHNLSQSDGCWIDDEAMVYDSAQVLGEAYVYKKARVYDYATVNCNAKVSENTIIHGDAFVTNDTLVTDCADIYESASVGGYCRVSNNAKVYGNAIVGGNASIFDDARVYGNAYIGGNARIMNHAEVSGNAFVTDETTISLSAVVKSMGDFLFIRNNFSSGRSITWTKSNGMYQTGCFYGTADELIAKAEEDDAYRRSSTYRLKTYHKAEYFRALVAMVERFKEIDAMDDEFIKQCDSVLDDAND